MLYPLSYEGARREVSRGRRALPLLGLLLLVVVALLPLDPHATYPHALGPLGLPTGPSAGHPLGIDVHGRDVLAGITRGLRNAGWQAVAGSLLASGLALAVGRLPRGGSLLRPGLGGAAEKLPPVILGLLLAAAGLPGGLAIVAAVAVGALPAALGQRCPRPLPLLTGGLPTGVLTAVTLSFLGVDPGAVTLGGELSAAGLEIRIGVNEWWGLLFPGLATVLVALICDRVALGLSRSRTAEPAPTRAAAALGGVGAVAIALALSLAGGFHGLPLGPTLAILAGALVLSVPATLLPARPFAYLPAPWLALTGVWLLATDIGRFPLLPRTYGSFGSLVIPWIVAAAALTGAAARLGAAAPDPRRLAAGRARWARAAGLTRRAVLRGRLRSTLATWPQVFAPVRLGTLAGATVTVEVVLGVGGARGTANLLLLAGLTATGGILHQVQRVRR